MDNKQSVEVITQEQTPGHSQLPILTPFQYPRWLKISAFLILIPFAHFLYNFQEYLSISKTLKQAHLAFEKKEFNKAISMYQDILDKAPDSKRVKIRLAQSYFALHNPYGLSFLEGLQLKKKEQQQLAEYMPKEFEQYFEKVA